MKQSDISQQLGSLISAQGNLCGNNNVNIDDSIPSELEEPAPAFEFDCKTELMKSKNDAMSTMNYIVDAVVPEEFRNHPSIKNQIKLDAIQLGSLYFQQNANNIVIENSLTTLASGDNNPRLYEVIEKLLKRASELADQITTTHAQYRKYYIDTYLDIESKLAADEEDKEALRVGTETKETPQIEDNGVIERVDGTVKIIGTKEQNKVIQDKKLAAVRERLSLEAQNKIF